MRRSPASSPGHDLAHSRHKRSNKAVLFRGAPSVVRAVGPGLVLPPAVAPGIVTVLVLFVAGAVQAQAPQSAPSVHNNYHLKHTTQKLVDNRGRGYEPLYGTRNVRFVLRGLVYRGGANNATHRTRPRDNRNPLPLEALRNLCAEGFGAAVYLYPTNFSTAPREVLCSLRTGGRGKIRYRQLSPKNKAEMRAILEMIHTAAHDSEASRPIYLHCWNGWHASGLASALILRQFCGLDRDLAVRYWDANTDGHNQEGEHEGFRQLIAEFVPYPDLSLPPERKQKLCPTLDELLEEPGRQARPASAPAKATPSRPGTSGPRTTGVAPKVTPPLVRRDARPAGSL